MKKATKKIYRIIILSVVILFLLLLNDYMSYSMRIGNTRFYLLESIYTPNDGMPLLDLYYKDELTDGYKGVEMSGFPKNILWNEKFLISKNYNGNASTIISYVIINLDSVNVYGDNELKLHNFKTETEYNKYLQQEGISESQMKQVDNRISWWELLFK